MKNKWQLIRQMGMIEARRRGIADKYDQLLFASRALAEELERGNGTAQVSETSGSYSEDTTLGYLIATIKEFKEDA